MSETEAPEAAPLATAAPSILAPAKINLALHVLGKRPDGFHDIETLAVFTRFGDRLSIGRAEADAFSVKGRYASDTPVDASNLVVRARDALRQRIGASAAQPVSIVLEKNLPVASGVGGGSSDAAAALLGLAQAWRVDAGDALLASIGAELGADVPMCLERRPLIAAGVGDMLEPLVGVPEFALVLVNPGRPVPTAAVFAALQSRDNAALPPLPKRLDFHGLRNWLAETRNDLEAAARGIEPSIGSALAALRKADAGFARMSGSGATCFGLFETGNVAKRAALAIRSRHPDWFVAATRSTASEG